jgi:KUP system potassium uptake protein
MTESAGNQARIDSHAPEGAPRSAFAGLALAAIGVVFGDIGTSPLYTLNTVFDPTNGLPLNAANVLGVVSLILWSLLIVVSLKYVTLIMAKAASWPCWRWPPARWPIGQS